MERPSAPSSWERYVSGDPVHDLASARGHEWLATCVPVQDVLSQGILSSSTTCGISGCSVEALHVTELFNRSLSSEVFPTQFKAAYITPLLKKPDLDPSDGK